MKKIIAYILVGILCLAAVFGVIYGVNYKKTNTDTDNTVIEKDDEVDGEEAMKKAVKYLKSIYKDVEKETPRDYDRIGVIPVGKLKFQVTWSVDVSEEYIKIVVNDDGSVTIDVNEECGEEIPYVLTATIADADGNTETLTWNHIIPTKITGTYQEIVDMAYALKPGEALQNEATLKGIIAKINTEWSESYKNITVTILVEGREDKPIMCYRLKGDGAKDLAVGDTIEVTGILKNYNGTIEFDAGCILESVTKGDGKAPELPTIKGSMQEIVDKAYALAENTVLEGGEAVLTGSVTKINTKYSADYKNVTVTIVVEGREDKPIECYRMKGTNADKVAVGDLITVRGTLKNYYGKVEFDAGCELKEWVKGGATYVPELPKPIEPTAPVGELGTGDKVVIYAPAYSMALSTKKAGYYNEGVLVSMKDGVLSGYKDTEVFTVTKNLDGTYYFENGGKKLGMADSHANVDLGAVNDKWQVIDLGKGLYNIKNVVRGNYLEWYDSYSNWSTYGTSNAATDDLFQMSFYVVSKGAAATETYTLEQAKEELVKLYAAEGPITNVDYTRIARFELGASKFKVTWTVNVAEEAVKVTYMPDGTYQIDVNEDTKEDVDYVLTATIVNLDDESKSIQATWEYKLEKAKLTPKQIVELAYELENGETLTYPKPATLTGTIVSVDTAYSTQYENVTVTIAVEGCEDKPIQCFRLKGTGADIIDVGDIITVTGTIKNYNGTVEFDSGCTLDAYTIVYTAEEILNAAYALETGATLEEPNPATLTGTIVSVDTAYSTQYNNVTVTIAVEGLEDKPIQCFRLKGDGADVIDVGDIITVTGTIKNYKGKVEFDSGCTLDEYTLIYTPEEIVNAAYALENGATLEEPNPATLTGTIVSVDTAYSTQYNNVTVTIAVKGLEDKPIQCFRLKGDGADVIGVGDLITVTGKIKNYNGKVEFDSGCTLDAYSTAKELATVDAAYALESGASLAEPATLTGTITRIKTAYNDQYGNITVVMTVFGREDKPIECFRLSGASALTLEAGDKITVTGTINNYNGTVQFNKGTLVLTNKEIVDAAFALKSGQTFFDNVTLAGTIVSVDTAYSTQFGNVTVTMKVVGSDGEKNLQCFRLTGTGADAIKEGDAIQVTGKITNYNGKIQFAQGCVLNQYVTADTVAIVDAAYALEKGAAMTEPATLTGTITSIKTAYNAQYENITVIITVLGCENKPIECFRLKGNGADSLQVGDIITVTGTISNYNGTVQFGAGSTFTK